MSQLNSNFVDLMEIDFLHIEKLNNSDLENKQSSVSRNGQSSISRNGQSLVSRNGQSLVSGKSQSLVSAKKQSSGSKVYSVSKPRVKHSEILKILLNHIEEVDFREEAGSEEDKEKLKYTDYLVTCSDKVLEAAEACGRCPPRKASRRHST